MGAVVVVVVEMVCSELGAFGLYIVGPLYRVITVAPATQHIVPITFAIPSFLFSRTCSILQSWNIST